MSAGETRQVLDRIQALATEEPRVRYALEALARGASGEQVLVDLIEGLCLDLANVKNAFKQRLLTETQQVGVYVPGDGLELDP